MSGEPTDTGARAWKGAQDGNGGPGLASTQVVIQVPLEWAAATLRKVSMEGWGEWRNEGMKK